MLLDTTSGRYFVSAAQLLKIYSYLDIQAETQTNFHLPYTFAHSHRQV
jgi:hypothetical protein